MVRGSFVYPTIVRTLFLDVTGADGLLAFVDDNQVVGEVSIDRKVRDAGLSAAAEACLKQAGWTWDSVERIACAVGPGGFMSIRVAVAFCNALAWARNIPLAGIHGSDIIFARVSTNCVWVHSTKSDEVFVRDRKIWPEPTHLKLSELLEKLPSDMPFAGDVLPDHARVLSPRKQLSLTPLTGILPKIISTLSYGESPLSPWYGRRA